MIDRAHFPRGLAASPAAMKAVLRCLDSHIRDAEACRLCLSTIAEETGLSERTSRAAVATLRNAMIVLTTQTGRSNVYSVDWKHLAYLREPDQETGEVRRSGRQTLPVRPAESATLTGSICRSTEAPFETPLKAPIETFEKARAAPALEETAEPPGERVLNETQECFLRIARVVLKKGTSVVRDREFVATTAQLVTAREISRDVLEQALEAVRLNAPTNRVAYFRTALVNGCRDNGVNYHHLEQQLQRESAV